MAMIWPCSMPPSCANRPPNQTMATMARFAITEVMGLSAAESLPTRMVMSDSVSPACWNCSISLSCFEKARMTRAPSRFSPARREITSCWRWIRVSSGRLRLITRYSTNTMSGVESRNTSAIFQLMVKAITMEPTVRNGARMARRINMFTPVCT